MAEMAQETVTEPPAEEAAEPMDMPSVDIDDEGMQESGPELAPMHEFIPQADQVGEPTRDLGAEKPAPVELEDEPASAEEPAAAPGLERDELERIARETIEKVVWEIVPQLAETILREEIEKLVQEKLSD
jgi:hypothetical protein